MENFFTTSIESNKLPSHLWSGYIVPVKRQSVAAIEGKSIAIRNKMGEGEVLWISSLIGLGSRIQKDYSALALLLNKELKSSITNFPAKFETIQTNVLMKTMESVTGLLTLLVNKSTETKTISLLLSNPKLTPTVLFAKSNFKTSQNRYSALKELMRIIIKI